MGKREYDDKEKTLVFSTDSRQTKRSEQLADSLVEVQETGLNIWEGCSQPLGTPFPAVGTASPNRSGTVFPTVEINIFSPFSLCCFNLYYYLCTDYFEIKRLCSSDTGWQTVNSDRINETIQIGGQHHRMAGIPDCSLRLLLHD